VNNKPKMITLHSRAARLLAVEVLLAEPQALRPGRAWSAGDHTGRLSHGTGAGSAPNLESDGSRPERLQG